MIITAQCGRLFTTLLVLAVAIAGPAMDDAGRIIVRPFAGSSTVLAVSAPAGQAPSRDMAARLRQRVTIRFEGADIAEVATFFHRQVGLNIILDPQLRRDPPPPIDLHVTGMTAAAALTWVLRQADITGVFRDEALYLSRDPVPVPRRLHLYDVGDLLAGPQDFPGPGLGLTADGGGQGAGLIIFTPQGGRDVQERMDIDTLAGFLEEVLDRSR